MQKDKVYLVGFMAAGKTTTASTLGNRLGWTVVDLDARIELQEQQSISEIFATHGERHFRAVEKRALTELLAHRHTVIATGGGTFVSIENRELINNDGCSAWLDVSLNTVVERLRLDGTRPLAAERDSMALLYAARLSAYKHAHLHLKADRATTDELVSQIVTYLGED